MIQITLTVDLTPRNLKILAQLCNESQEEAEPEALKPIEIPAKPVEVPAKPVEAPAPATVEAPAPAVKTYSKTDVKAVCLQYSKAGRQEELKAAFAKFGAKKLTEVPEADYPALMEALGNAT